MVRTQHVQSYFHWHDHFVGGGNCGRRRGHGLPQEPNETPETLFLAAHMYMYTTHTAVLNYNIPCLSAYFATYSLTDELYRCGLVRKKWGRGLGSQIVRV